MNPLIKNFNEYIQIMDNHDMYNESVINIDSCNFLTPTIIAPLISLMYNYNKKIKAHESPVVEDYFNKALGITKPKDTTLPFRFLDEATDNSEELTKEILNIIKPAKEETQALKYLFHEVISNVYDHSEFDNGFVIGQTYPNPNITDFSFMDNGISIPGSLKEFNIHFKNDCDAIIKAINGESTKTDPVGYVERGTGLNSVINIVTRGARGSVLIASGKGLIEITRNRIFPKEIPQDYIKGTLVNLRLHNNRKIDIYEHMGYVEYVL